jgi:hypothetical protein
MQQSNSYTTLPIAPGLYDIISKFDAQKLKSGSIAEQNREKNNWQYGKDVSVYIGWVPDELLPIVGSSEGPAHEFFGRFGKISRVEFVPKFTAERKQNGHMAFIHYSSFYTDSGFSRNIAASHPLPYEVDWSSTNRYGKRKDYKLKCCININAIRKVEYNASQLTDMFERLNQRVMDEIQHMKDELRELREENAALRSAASSSETNA